MNTTTRALLCLAFSFLFLAAEDPSKSSAKPGGGSSPPSPSAPSLEPKLAVELQAVVSRVLAAQIAVNATKEGQAFLAAQQDLQTRLLDAGAKLGPGCSIGVNPVTMILVPQCPGASPPKP